MNIKLCKQIQSTRLYNEITLFHIIYLISCKCFQVHPSSRGHLVMFSFNFLFLLLSLARFTFFSSSLLSAWFFSLLTAHFRYPLATSNVAVKPDCVIVDHSLETLVAVKCERLTLRRLLLLLLLLHHHLCLHTKPVLVPRTLTWWSFCHTNLFS